MVLTAALLAGGGEAIAPGFERIECPVDVSWTGETIDCHIFTIPLDHDDPARGEIELAVMRIRSSAADPQPDPVVYLEGGPGGAPIFYFDSWIGSPILAERDIILIDQRGTGFSWPSLVCPETYDVYTPEEVTVGFGACQERFEAEGIDLSLFNSVQTAHDLESIRTTLDIEQWNLYGISYGTRVALTAMRLHPEGIRSAILDSTVPPNVDLVGSIDDIQQAAIAGLIGKCAGDDDCTAGHGDLREKIDKTKERLGSEGAPVDIPWLDGTDTFYREYVTGDDFEYGLGVAMYDSSLIPILPWIIDRVADGDDEVLATLMALAWYTPPAEGQADGAYYAVLCSEEAPFVPASSMEAERRASQEGGFPPLADICAAWDLEPADAVEAEAVTSDIPTLILAGGLDPATPPEWGSVAAATLANSQVVTIEGGGHGVSVDGCGLEVALGFLEDPNSPVEAGCTTNPLRFSTRPVPVSQIDLINGNSNEFRAAMLAILAWMGAAVVGVGMWRWRIGGGPHHVMWMLALAAMGLHFVGVVTYLAISLGSSSSAPIFIQPAWTWPLFLIPYLALGLTLMAVLTTVVAMARSTTPVWAVVPYGVLGLMVVLLVIANGVAGLLPWI